MKGGISDPTPWSVAPTVELAYSALVELLKSQQTCASLLEAALSMQSDILASQEESRRFLQLYPWLQVGSEMVVKELGLPEEEHGPLPNSVVAKLLDRGVLLLESRIQIMRDEVRMSPPGGGRMQTQIELVSEGPMVAECTASSHRVFQALWTEAAFCFANWPC